MNQAIISLGSNKGRRLDCIRKALRLIEESPLMNLEDVSSLYKTDPVDDASQPYFYNAAALLKTSLDAQGVLQSLQTIEKTIGKEKEGEKGPRRIDIDLLFFNDDVIDQKDLTVPHPSIQDRLFVLKPLMEIAPFYIHPVSKKSVRDMYFQLKTDKVVRLIKPVGVRAAEKGSSAIRDSLKNIEKTLTQKQN